MKCLTDSNSTTLPYIDGDGKVYESYETYCKSPDLEPYTVMLYLHSGARTPQNDYERHLLDEMREIERNGGIVDLTEGTW